MIRFVDGFSDGSLVNKPDAGECDAAGLFCRNSYPPWVGLLQRNAKIRVRLVELNWAEA